MKKKLNKKVIGYVAFIVAGVAITACGTAHTKYNTAGVTASQTAATTTIPTAIQGLWTSCSNGALTSMSFFDNGYWMETDQNSASDCSGTTTSSGTEEIGTFVMGAATAANTGSAQTITFTPSVIGSTDSYNSYYFMANNTMYFSKTGTGFAQFTVDNFTNSSSN